MYEALTLDDFKHILYIIRDNHKKSYPLTHKQVRVYLDCMEQLWEKVHIADSYWLPSVKVHFWAMSCRISHEKRSFLASELLKLFVLLGSKQQNLTEIKSDQSPAQENLTSEEPGPDDIPFDPATKTEVSKGF
ncbi:hypothetical protein [Nostoc sp.]|uniref:hypothetical protein n=1 Tax=Nostoc sp. TaxID=1180 RepID=UPI002FF0771C